MEFQNEIGLTQRKMAVHKPSHINLWLSKLRFITKND